MSDEFENEESPQQPDFIGSDVEISREEIESALKTLLKCPQILDKIISTRLKERRRRANWSKLSNAPYYNKRYATELKLVLDEAITSGIDKEFRFKDYPEIKPTSLYLRINQARMFLLDELDPEGYYINLLTSKLHIKREKTGIRVYHIRGTGVDLKAVNISEEAQTCKWKKDLDDYVANAKIGDKPLHLKDLSLTMEEVETLKESFINIDTIMALVTPTEIKVMKVPGGGE